MTSIVATSSTIFSIQATSNHVLIQVSWWLLAICVLAFLAGWFVKHRRTMPELRWEPVSATINLGGIGAINIAPNSEDIQIAHRAWVELATRKAAILFDEENDVITEVYDSWYSLFQTMRDLTASIPADLVRRDDSTRKLVQLLVDALNDGLRPHLTKWQARFRHWYAAALQDPSNAGLSPQEIQTKFPNYSTLVADLKGMNGFLLEYSRAIKAIAHGEAVQVAPSARGPLRTSR